MAGAYSDSFVLELKLNTNQKDDQFLSRCFYHAAVLHNTLVRYCRKQITKLRQNKEYRSLLSEYVRLKDNDPKRKALSKELSAIVAFYGLTKPELEKFIKIKRIPVSRYINSMVAQKIAASVRRSVEQVLYSNGKQIHFKKFNEVLSFEEKTNDTGVVFRNNQLRVMKRVIPVQHPKNEYEKECLTHRVKYCRVVRKAIGKRYHYYVQLVLEGAAPIKHKIGTGRGGLDIGTSTVAFVSDTDCILTLLGDGLHYKEEEKQRLQRAMDRSRRAMNPSNYNQDGTIRKGRKKWIVSNRYRKLRMRYKSLCRAYSASLKTEQEILANRLTSQANEVYVETMDFKALQKRSKETKKNSNGRYVSKKRYGRSLHVRAPAQFVSILAYKLAQSGGALIKINTVTFKASQYNHISDTYVQKKLSKRHNIIDGIWVQRDLYSAFLLKNSAPDLEHCDRTACFKTYNTFLNNHDRCISTIRSSVKNIPASFGLM